jgi:hypothetical protein
MATGRSPWEGAHHNVGAKWHGSEQGFNDFTKLPTNSVTYNGISHTSAHGETHTNWLINLPKQAMNYEIGATSTRTLTHSQREVS